MKKKECKHSWIFHKVLDGYAGAQCGEAVAIQYEVLWAVCKKCLKKRKV